MRPLHIKNIVEQALLEDLGPSDPLYEGLGERGGEGEIVAGGEGLFCGGDLLRSVFLAVGPKLSLKVHIEEGSKVQRGDIVAVVSGKIREILSGERVALNFIQRASGIATMTNRFVRKVEGTGVKIVDTRKTTPGIRCIEKFAVRCGGGWNHRFSLGDGVLIKENSIKAFGSISSAVSSVKRVAHHLLKIEVEVETMEEFEEAMKCRVDAVLLDNMTPEMVREAVVKGQKKLILEASGGITLENVRSYAETGVDFISSGFLTHSAPALDFSLKVK